MDDQTPAVASPPSSITTGSTAPTMSTIGTASQQSGQQQQNQGGKNKWGKGKPFVKWDDFKGDTEGLPVIGLRHEKFKQGEIHSKFMESVQRWIVREFDSGADVRPAFSGKDPLIALTDDEPKVELEDNASASDKFNAEKKLEALWNQHGKRREKLRRNTQKAYGLVLGQCSKALRAELKALDDYDDKNDECDLSWLVECISKITAGVDTTANKQLVLAEKIMEYMNPRGETRQQKAETLDEYMARFQQQMATIEMAGGDGMFVPFLFDNLEALAQQETVKTTTDDDYMVISRVKLQKFHENSKEKMMSMMFGLFADDEIFGDVIDEMKEAADFGNDIFPKTQVSYYELLLKRLREKLKKNPSLLKNRYGKKEFGSGGVQFTQAGGRNDTNRSGSGNRQERFVLYHCSEKPLPEGYVAGTNGKWCNRDCNTCHKMGHTARFCPEGKSPTKYIFSQYLFSEIIDGLDISDNILLLDTGATNTTTNSMNECMDDSVKKCDDEDILYAKTNGGMAVFDEKGDLKSLPMKAHYSPDSLTTILSFKEVHDLEGVHMMRMHST